MATNLFRKTQSLYASTANTFSTGDSETITPASVSGLPTDTEMTLTFDRVDSSGTETPTKMERIIGVVTGGNFVSRVTTGRGADGSTEQAHTSPVVEYIPNAKDMDDAVDGILVEHTQAGLHKNIATASDVATATNNTKIVTPLAVAPYANNSLNRQAIINGNFDIWQRGTSGFTADEYTADRWIQGLSGASMTTSRQAFTVGQTDVPNNPNYYLRMNVTTGADMARIMHKIEGVEKFSGQEVTLSFWAKGTNPGGGVIYTGYLQAFGSGGSAAVEDYEVDSHTLTSSWQKFTSTFTVPSISGKTVGASSYLQIHFNQASDTSADAWVLDLSQVQLCAGSVALPFQPKSYGEELAACERYYQSSFDYGVTPAINLDTPQISSVATGTIGTFPIKFSVRMRTTPTMTTWNKNVSTTGISSLAWTEINDAFNFALERTDGNISTNHKNTTGFTLKPSGVLSAGYSKIKLNWQADAEL